MIIKVPRNKFRDAIEAGIASAGGALSGEFRDRLRGLVEETEFVGATFTSRDPEFGICANCPVSKVTDKYGHEDLAADSIVWDFIDGYDNVLHEFLDSEVDSAEIVFRIYD